MCAVLLSSSPAPNLLPLSGGQGWRPSRSLLASRTGCRAMRSTRPWEAAGRQPRSQGWRRRRSAGARLPRHAPQRRAAAKGGPVASRSRRAVDRHPPACSRARVSGPRRGATLSAGPGVQPQPSNLRRGPPRSGSIREGAACQPPAGRRPSRQGQPTPRSAVAGGRAKPSRPQAVRRG